MPASPPTPVTETLGFRLGRLQRALRRRWEADLSDLHLTPPQSAILRAISAAPGSGIRALARSLDVDAMSVKRCVDDLEDRGLVESGHRSLDRRPRTLRLTAGGLALVARVNQRQRRREEDLASALSPTQMSRLTAALARLEAHLGIGAPDDEEEEDA